jgi:hypothetical protein
MGEKIDSAIFPVVAWRIAVGSVGGGDRLTFLEVGYARTISEARAAEPGRPPPNKVPLGLTPQQCRDLAADLVEAVNKAEGRAKG